MFRNCVDALGRPVVGDVNGTPFVGQTVGGQFILAVLPLRAVVPVQPAPVPPVRRVVVGQPVFGGHPNVVVGHPVFGGYPNVVVVRRRRRRY